MNPFRKLMQRFWQSYVDGPEWRVILATYLIGAGAAGLGAVYAPQLWLTIFDALLAGWCLHGAVTTRMMKWYRDSFEDMRKDLRSMHELNRAMLEERVRLHLVDIGADNGPAKTIN